jgi:hypothetical protein
MANKKDDPGIIMKLKEQHSKVIHSYKCDLKWRRGMVNLCSDFLKITDI